MSCQASPTAESELDSVRLPEVGSKDHFVLTLWTNEPALASRADAAGVDRIGLDLETYKKAERQPKSLATWISPHREEQLPGLREAIKSGKLFCRINPINPGSHDEIERLVDYGVQVMMLPMFTTPQEVEAFVKLVKGRADCVLLLENVTAAERVREIVQVPGICDVHVGLNDLTLSLGRKNANRFAVMATDLMLRISEAVRGAGVRFGVGGIGRAMDNDQKVPADLIYAQYARLGATAALIARTFFGSEPDRMDVSAEIKRARQRLAWWAGRPAGDLAKAREQFARVTEAQTW